jgi:hypothetical protein
MNIEAAARALCKFAGKDPDAGIKVALPGGAYSISGEKLWTKYVEPAKACVEASSGWQPIESAPEDGTPIITSRIVRYLPYKPDGQRQMKAKGRWQEHNGYGWENTQLDPVEWQPMTEKSEVQSRRGTE